MITDERFDELVDRARTHARSVADSLSTGDKVPIFQFVLNHLIANERANGFEGLSFLSATGAQAQTPKARQRPVAKAKKRVR